MKVCVIGSNGQLGSDVCACFREKHEVIPLVHKDLDITDKNACFQVLSSYCPDVVVNTAAFHNVPLCEKEMEKAWAVNVLGPKNLAEVCSSMRSQLVHYSTDYVFDGQKKVPYLEEDLPEPLNFYGITKLAGEHAVAAYGSNYKIVRVSGIYGRVPSRAKGTNFVLMMLKLAEEKDELNVVNDEWLTPTSTFDIAKQTEQLTHFNDAKGIFHMSNDGHCSWYEFAKAIFEITGKKMNVNPVTASFFPPTVNRPKWSVLENKALKELGIYQMPYWKDALKAHLNR